MDFDITKQQRQHLHGVCDKLIGQAGHRLSHVSHGEGRARVLRVTRLQPITTTTNNSSSGGGVVGGITGARVHTLGDSVSSPPAKRPRLDGHQVPFSSPSSARPLSGAAIPTATPARELAGLAAMRRQQELARIAQGTNELGSRACLAYCLPPVPVFSRVLWLLSIQKRELLLFPPVSWRGYLRCLLWKGPAPRAYYLTFVDGVHGGSGFQSCLMRAFGRKAHVTPGWPISMREYPCGLLQKGPALHRQRLLYLLMLCTSLLQRKSATWMRRMTKNFGLRSRPVSPRHP